MPTSASPAKTSDQISADSGAPRRSLRVLYADDVRELREIVRVSIGRDGHQIECVEDGEVALAHLTAAPDCDLLITDHSMPKMDGLELVTRLRAQKFPGKIVIFCSELSAAVAAQYRAMEVDRILYKPIFPSTLRQVLVELFPDAGLPPT